jgi:hypothetical protein
MKKENRFQSEQLTSQGSILTHVITDSETGVQYLLAISPSMGSGLAALVSQDGKLMVRR